MQFITIKNLEEMCEGKIIEVYTEGKRDKWIIAVFTNGMRFKFPNF